MYLSNIISGGIGGGIMSHVVSGPHCNYFSGDYMSYISHYVFLYEIILVLRPLSIINNVSFNVKAMSNSVYR